MRQPLSQFNGLGTRYIYVSIDASPLWLTNKKVFLRERKRHTSRRVASARYADLSREGGTLSQVRGGGGYPIPYIVKYQSVNLFMNFCIGLCKRNLGSNSTADAS